MASIVVRRHARARVTKTLFVRAQRARRVGINEGRSGSKELPRVEANKATRSNAAPESLVRSEFMAELRGREKLRVLATISRVSDGEDAL